MVVVKNEARYLTEWLDYHLLIGVQHFYIYDNKSLDNTKDVLKWYIDNGLVTYRYLNEDFEINSEAWPHRKQCIGEFGDQSEWMLFIDPDEFIYVNSEEYNIHHLLSMYSDFSAIAMRQIDFGSSGILKYDNNYVIQKFVKRTKSPTSVKSLIKPKEVVGCINGHIFNVGVNMKHPYTITTQRKIVIISKKDEWLEGSGPIRNDIFYLHHYKVKSKEEYLNIKGKSEDYKKFYTEKRFNLLEKTLNVVEDKKMHFYLPYLPLVRKNILFIKKFYESKNSNLIFKLWNSNI